MISLEQPLESVGGWFHLLPYGEFEHEETGCVQVIDRAALEHIDTAFRRDQEARHFAGLLTDQEHFSYDLDKSTEARGWIKDMGIRADGLWVQIEMTDVGEREVAGRRYKFLSAAFLPADLKQLGGGRVRPLRLDSAAFTNRPRIKPLTPMANRGAAGVAAGTLFLPDPDPRLPEIAAETLFVLARREPGQSFQERWGRAKLRYPLLNRTMRQEQILMNRGYHDFFELDPSDQALLARGREELLVDFNTQDRWENGARMDLPFFPHKNILRDYARKWMKEIRSKEGLTHAQAFERLEDLHPLLYINLCINQGLGPDVTGRWAPIKE